MERWYEAGIHAAYRRDRDLARASEWRLLRADRVEQRNGWLRMILLRLRSPQPAPCPPTALTNTAPGS
jgi:hypothetical protein